MEETLKMKKKSFLVVTILVIAAIVPILAFQAQAILSAGPNQTVSIGQTVNFNGTTTDNASSIVQVTWNFGDNSSAVNGSSPGLLNATHVYANPGVYNATLTVKFDSTLNKTETAIATITVSDTVAPVVNAGQNVTVEQASHAGTQVTLNGTATDAVSTRFNFTWSENNTVLKTETNVTKTTLTRTFNLGVHIVTLNATDEAGNTGSANVTVKVVDTKPPEISETATPDVLWSPDHQYVEVKVNVTATDVCDPSPKITLLSVTSNEPDNGKGDGNTVDDFVIVDNYTFSFRAERAGIGSGRTYTIAYKATDASNNTATASVTVTVPHNQ